MGDTKVGIFVVVVVVVVVLSVAVKIQQISSTERNRLYTIILNNCDCKTLANHWVLKCM